MLFWAFEHTTNAVVILVKRVLEKQKVGSKGGGTGSEGSQQGGSDGGREGGEA